MDIEARLTDAHSVITPAEEWTAEQVREFQTYFDKILAGDQTARRHLIPLLKSDAQMEA
jgi:hypothetical protein